MDLLVRGRGGEVATSHHDVHPHDDWVDGVESEGDERR
jgi:hypothetical protein